MLGLGLGLTFSPVRAQTRLVYNSAKKPCMSRTPLT